MHSSLEARDLTTVDRMRRADYSPDCSSADRHSGLCPCHHQAECEMSGLTDAT